MALIALDGIRKEYRSAEALRGIDLEVGAGQWVSIIGPSGSGKSTLLNIIGGLDRPTAGRVRVDDQELTGLGENALALFRRERIGYVFQQAHLIPYLTAVENVMLAQYFHSMPDEAEASAALGQVGLAQRLHHRSSELSGGEQQRVCIARALINSPKILLADEPTGNLDRENTTHVLDLLRALHIEREFTIILVTHDPYVSKWAGRILCMEDGRISSDECVQR